VEQSWKNVKLSSVEVIESVVETDRLLPVPNRFGGSFVAKVDWGIAYFILYKHTTKSYKP